MLIPKTQNGAIRLRTTTKKGGRMRKNGLFFHELLIS